MSILPEKEIIKVSETKIPMFIIKGLEGIVKNSLLITGSGVLASSLLASNPMKGVVYLVILIIAILGRIGILMISSYTGPENDSEMCAGLPGPLNVYDGGRNNIFSLSFTIWYIALPMFLEKNMNWYMLFALIVQLALTCFITYGKGCVSKMVTFVLEILGGSFYGCATSVIMYYAGLKSFLMLSGIPTEEEAKNKMQSLKCVIKRGNQLVANKYSKD